MPQLDALRALAVIAVWFEHWGVKELPVFRWFGWGLLGVRLFFVLSGFLITGILLQARDEVDAERAAGGFAPGGIRRAAVSFYARRFLRILPIYYLTLFVITALALRGVWSVVAIKPLFKWHLTYLTNFYWVLHGEPRPGAGGHFWTLAIEEQFYLVWPWVVLFVPRRQVLKAVIVAAGAAVLFRMGCALTRHVGTVGMIPIACFDQFALGAALAVIGHDAKSTRPWDMFTRWCLWLGAPVMAASIVLSARQQLDRVTFVTAGLSMAAVFTWVIARAARGFGGVLGAALEWRPMLYLGRISYGLYVYHPFVGALIAWALVRSGLRAPQGPWTRVTVFGAATVLVATASWHFIEKPINGLKRHFKYAPSRRAKPDLAAPGDAPNRAVAPNPAVVPAPR